MARSFRNLCFLILLAAWGVSQAQPAVFTREGVLVDEVVAVVNRQVITRSEVWQEAVMVLVARRGPGGVLREITPEFLSQVMELLINQTIFLDEARRLGLPPVTERQRERLLHDFRRSFSDQEVYSRFLYDNDLTEEMLGEILARHLRVERMKERKLKLMPEVGDEAVRQYYQKNRLHFGQMTLEQVAEAIRLKLLEQEREQALTRWIWELRKRSEVKVLVDLASQPISGDG